MDLDDVLPEVGEFGRYQKLVLWFILLPGVFPCGFHAYNQLFMAAAPDHWCKVDGFTGKSAKLIRNISIPTAVQLDGQTRFSQCTMYDLNYTNTSLEFYESVNYTTVSIVPCKHGWVYDKQGHENTIITEWDLVCEKDLFSTIALVLFGIGGLIGNYLFGYIQDGIGRKPSFFIYLFIQSVFGMATAFATNFTAWTIFRMGVGFTVPAILSTPYVLAIEIVGPRHRTLVTILVNIAYSLALVALAIIVWVIREWHLLALATTVPFLSLFLHWWLLPESPRWLLAQGRVREAEQILIQMARINGKKLPYNFVSELRREEVRSQVPSSFGIRHLFHSSNLRWKTIIITFIWFTNTSVYVGLSYYAPALGGDEYLNFFLAGAVELPTYLFLWPAMEKWGRRWTLCVSMVVGGSACLTTFLVQNDSVITLALYCVGKMGISSSFVVLPLMASELYPTVVRGLGISVSSMVGMLGPVFIPLVNYLGSDMLTLPLIIMGTMLVMGGACSLLLPETLNQHLPQTLQDAEKAGLDCFACCTPPQLDVKMQALHESRLQS
ncbi:beta-alanine transporter [Zophobas morio]|uniref:beta-alanine transporter n=1 Tax=Zophobas morio TaxID=2755281 RepID=UPI003082E447